MSRILAEVKEMELNPSKRVSRIGQLEGLPWIGEEQRHEALQIWK